MSFKKVRNIIKIEDYTIPNSDIRDIDGEIKYKLSNNFELPHIGSSKTTTFNLGQLENGKDLYQENRYERLLLDDKDTIKKTFIYYTIDYIPIEKKKKKTNPKLLSKRKAD